mgnify:CR=1 FL=1
MYLNTKYPKTINIRCEDFINTHDIWHYFNYEISQFETIINKLSKEEKERCLIVISSNAKLISLHNAVILLRRVISKNRKNAVKELGAELLNHWSNSIDLDYVKGIIPECAATLELGELHNITDKIES